MALVFYAVPAENARAILVLFYAALPAALFTIGMLIAVAVRAIRHARIKPPRPEIWRQAWAIWAVAVIVVEAVAVVGLNAYADSRVQPAIAMLEDSYAQEAILVAHGNALVAAKKTSSADWESLSTEAESAYLQAEKLDVSGPLYDFHDAITAWAYRVELDSFSASDWQNAPQAPDPFTVDLSEADGNYDFYVALQQTQTLIDFGTYAASKGNSEALLDIGAHLSAITYWLDGVYSSRDPSFWRTAFRFVEPIDLSNPTSSTASLGATPVNLAAAVLSSARVWRSPRSWNPHLGRGPWPSVLECLAGCWGTLKPKFGGLIRITPMNPSYTLATSSLSSDWQGAANAIAPSLPPPPPNAPSPLSLADQFDRRCSAQGGKNLGDQNLSNMQRLPTTERGWECLTNGNRCWTFLTYSGIESKGGDQGCPEQNLQEPDGGPLAGPYQTYIAPVVSAIGRLIPNPRPTNDGTYTLQWAQARCSSNVAGVPASISPGVSTITVVNNVVTFPNDPTTIPIDSSGHATWHYVLNQQGANASGDINFYFANGSVTGNWAITSTASSYGYTATISCSGTVSGSRN